MSFLHTEQIYLSIYLSIYRDLYLYIYRVSHNGWHGGVRHLSYNFYETPYQNRCPHIKIESPIREITSSAMRHWKMKLTSTKWFTEKILEKLETVINTCFSIIKQHWKKMEQIRQEPDFITWSMLNFKKYLLKNVMLLD